MKFLRIIFSLAFIILLAGCHKKEFSINFDVEKSMNANYKLIYYASDKHGGYVRESAVAITNGKGDFKGQTINPSLVYIFTGKKSYPLVIYVERGEEITVAGNEREPLKWMVEGNEINKEWSEWRIKNSSVLSTSDSEKINKIVGKYVIENPENPLSALLLLTTYSRYEDETGFRRLWRDLKGEAADHRWADLAGRADVPQRFVPVPARVESMAFRSMQNGTDTIFPDSVKASLLFFWSNTISDRKELTDSLKVLAKEFPDSSSRLIADICLDPDSSAWRSNIRYDSLKNVARLWAPAGLADSRVMLLDVPRVPFFIVLTPDGHQRFRGSEAEKAFSFFRKTLKSSTKK